MTDNQINLGFAFIVIAIYQFTIRRIIIILSRRVSTEMDARKRIGLNCKHQLEPIVYKTHLND